MSETFSKAIKSKEIFFKYAKGERDIFGREFHNYHEIFFFLNGDAEFISEGTRISLEPETLVIIPKEKYHQFNVFGSESDYIRCVYNFSEITEISELIKEKLNNVFVIKSNNETKNLFNKAINIIEKVSNESLKIQLIKSVLILLLYEIENDKKIESTQNNFNEITNHCIKYISENIYEQISIEKISKEFNLSPSYITHIFKKDMNISIYKYILEKKLIIANQLIISGAKPTNAALECGFNDYSGFYRQFKKMFGHSPSKS